MCDAERDSAGLTGMGQTPLTGRVALVTGASAGIGRATARALPAAGAQVGLATRRAERLRELEQQIVQGGTEAIALPTDVTDYAQAEAMTRCAEETFGGVDVQVNAAGIMLPAPIAGADPADWRRMVEVNFGELRKGEVRTIYLLGSRAELFRRCHTRPNPGTSLKRSMPEDPLTPPAMPSNHLQHTDARDEVSG